MTGALRWAPVSSLSATAASVHRFSIVAASLRLASAAPCWPTCRRISARAKSALAISRIPPPRRANPTAGTGLLQRRKCAGPKSHRVVIGTVKR
jgi:hypothetical protein